MFIADLQKAYDKERAAGRAKKKEMKQMKEMEDTIQELGEKMEKQDQYRSKMIENKKHEMREKNNIWDKRRIEVKNKELLIEHKDYQELVPAQFKPKSLISLQVADIKTGANTTRGKSRGAAQSSPTNSGKGKDLSPKKKNGRGASEFKELHELTQDGVVVHAPEYLSKFTIDKPKIDFFK